MRTKKRKSLSYKLSIEPSRKKLPWPGLKAKDRLSRIVTREVKEVMETRERDAWAEEQIAKVLDHVPLETALRLVFREMSRQAKPVPRFAKSLFKGLPDWT